LTEKLNQAEAEMYGMKEKDKKEKRMASLVEAGMDAEEAEVQLETFANLNDDQFDVFVSAMKRYMKGGKVKAEEDSEAGMHGDMKKKDEKKDDDAEAGMHDDEKKKKDDEAKAEELEAEVVEASEEVLDTAEVQEEANLSVASEDIETEAVASLRSNLNDWVTQKVLKK
jgi:hypothetical protein